MRENIQATASRKKMLTPDAVKSTVTLLNNHVVWLDTLSTKIRSNSMAIVDRGSIIRALISALKESDLDLTHIKSEDEARKIILAKLRN